MKIDRNLSTHDTQAADGTRRTSTEATSRTGGPAPAPGAGKDRVELSGDAALFAAAVRAADEAPAVRTDLVEKMRKKLQDGQLGADPLKLADAMLDGLK